MPITFSCTQCGKKLKAPDNATGKKVRCPGCELVLEVPEPIFEAESVEPAAPKDEGGAYAVAPSTTSPPEQAQREPRRPCPMCGEMIRETAAKCRYCGEILDEDLRRVEKRKGRYSSSDDTDMTAAEWVLAVLCPGIGCIVGIVYIAMGKPKGTKMLGVSFLVGAVFTVIRVAIEMAMVNHR